MTVTVTEENGTGAAGSGSFDVTVSNLTPALTPVADQIGSEGGLFTMAQLSFSDPGFGHENSYVFAGTVTSVDDPAGVLGGAIKILAQESREASATVCHSAT